MIESSSTWLLAAFTRRLAATYRELNDDSGRWNRALLTLALAETMLAEQRVGVPLEERPLHVAVVGPTQAGKSTVVNLLLDQTLAEASPLAAFTRELSGFMQSRGDEEGNRIRAIFEDDQPHLETAPGDGGENLVVWDTPDFDSHLSHEYRTLIARVGALADVIVLVVSKEKYADLSVWDTLDALRPLNRTLVVCLNKVSSDQEILSAAVKDRLRESNWDDGKSPVLILPHAPGDDAFVLLSRTEEAQKLRQLVIDPAHRRGADSRQRDLCDVFTQNWDDWLRPVQEELVAAQQWQREIEQRLQQAKEIYEEQYLDHTSHNDAFKQAVLQLLELLEIPVLAGPLTRARNVLTWPLRKLTGLFDEDGERGRGEAEADILQDVMQHAMLALHSTIIHGTEEAGQTGEWWRSLGRTYHGEAGKLKTVFCSEVTQYQADFEPEIEDAARSLFDRLEENPVMLNTLRASRLGADTAGILFAVNTGTVGVADALLTPAMLSLTSMMTEGAVGQYMETIREKLLGRQRALVQRLFNDSLREGLLEITNRSPDAGLFRISEAELEKLMRARKEICS
jgi:GTPase SAR1 family protein